MKLKQYMSVYLHSNEGGGEVSDLTFLEVTAPIISPRKMDGDASPVPIQAHARNLAEPQSPVHNESNESWNIEVNPSASFMCSCHCVLRYLYFCCHSASVQSLNDEYNRNK